MDKRDISVIAFFIAIITITYLGISSGFLKNSISKVISTKLNRNFGSDNEIILHPTTCKLAPIYVRNTIDNLTSVFNGIFYNRPFLLCVRFKDLDYCLQSKVIKINNFSIAYFDKICMIERNIDPNLPFVDINYKKISNYKEINKSVILQFAYFSDKKLYDALKNS